MYKLPARYKYILAVAVLLFFVFSQRLNISLPFTFEDAQRFSKDVLGVTLLTPPPSPTVTPTSTTSGQLYRVVTIVDGDTIKLSSGQTIRYIGMDTPELHHPTKGKQCFGIEAKQKNSELVLGKDVRLVKDVNETDRYGRLLRYVYIGDVLVNEALVREGYAFARSYPPDIRFQDVLREAERKAREENRGLWSSCPL